MMIPRTAALLLLITTCLPALALEPLKSKQEILRDWQGILGPLPAAQVPLKLEVLKTETLSDFTRQYVRYQLEDNLWTDGYILIPAGLKAGQKVPGVAVFHSTVKQQAQLVAGVDQAVPEKMQGVQMALMGYVALCPRNFLFNEGGDFKANTAAVLKRRHTGMAQMLWDGMRALDVLAALPQVDATRLGALGHSLGAKEALYLAAFDERVKAAVSSEGGIGMSMTNWEADWYLGAQVKAPGFTHDHHELLALIAPRAYLWIGGDSADTDAGLPYLKAAQPLFAAQGVPDNVEFFNHRLGHAYPSIAREHAEAFLKKALGAGK